VIGWPQRNKFGSCCAQPLRFLTVRLSFFFGFFRAFDPAMSGAAMV